MFNNLSITKKIFLLQRNEYQSNCSLWLRKKLGRVLHTKFLINIANHNIKKINKKFFKDMNKEYQDLKKYIPSDIKSVIDIGSGIGAINIFLNRYHPTIREFILVDKNFISKKVRYGFVSGTTEGYNKLAITKKFLMSNGIDSEKIFLFDFTNDKLPTKKYDLVISLISMGYHYPIENYLNYLKKNSTKNTVFIFDIADQFISFEDLKSIFEEIVIINKVLKKHSQTRVVCKILK